MGNDDSNREGIPSAAASKGLKRSRSTQACLFEDDNPLEEEEEEGSSKQCGSVPSLHTTFEETTTMTATTRTRSNLFGEEEQETSILAPATRLLQDGAVQQQASSKKNATSASLFGAVMKNVETSSNHHPSTPARKNKFANALSPGGFQLQNFISGLGDSPFQKIATPSSNNKTPSSGAATPRRDVEWHECSIQRSHLGLIDWSLKSALDFQCQPAMQMLLLDACSAGGAHQGKVMRRFINPTTTNDDNVRSASCSAAAVDWQAGLLYWQHPATYPLPNQLFHRGQATAATAALNKHEKDEKSKGIDTKLSGSNSGNTAGRLFAAVPRRKAAFMATEQQMESDCSSSNNNNDLLTTRAREWQDAFRSLYCTWLERIRQIDTRLQQGIGNVLKEITETYFYASGKGHTLLFRVGVVQRLDDDDNNTAGEDDGTQQQVHLVPEIIVSSSSLSLREKLRSMGAKLFLLESWNGMKGEFQEENVAVRTTSQSSSASSAAAAKQLVNGNNNNSDDAASSPNVKAELVALRRAQVFGETVGADVSVSIKPANNNNASMWSKSPKRIPPLRVTGVDDCAAFFEVYFNTYGQITGVGKIESSRSPELIAHDVPLLLSRKLGPFLHSSVKSLSTIKKRNVGECTSDGYESISVHGILLPCAVRDLICAFVSAMKADEQAFRKNDSADERTDDDDDDDDEDVGSHHLVVRATAYGGVEAQAAAAPVGTGTVGSHSSKWFNAGPDLLGQLQESDDAATQSCHYDEVLLLAVWDITRPKSLAYKLEHMSANLLG